MHLSQKDQFMCAPNLRGFRK